MRKWKSGGKRFIGILLSLMMFVSVMSGCTLTKLGADFDLNSNPALYAMGLSMAENGGVLIDSWLDIINVKLSHDQRRIAIHMLLDMAEDIRLNGKTNQQIRDFLMVNLGGATPAPSATPIVDIAKQPYNYGKYKNDPNGALSQEMIAQLIVIMRSMNLTQRAIFIKFLTNGATNWDSPASPTNAPVGNLQPTLNVAPGLSDAFYNSLTATEKAYMDERKSVLTVYAGEAINEAVQSSPDTLDQWRLVMLVECMNAVAASEKPTDLEDDDEGVTMDRLDEFFQPVILDALSPSMTASPGPGGVTPNPMQIYQQAKTEYVQVYQYADEEVQEALNHDLPALTFASPTPVPTATPGSSGGGGSSGSYGTGATPIPDKTMHIAYVTGYSDGTFRPNVQVARQEIATMLFRLSADGTKDNYVYDGKFSDVPTSLWSAKYIGFLNKLGAINGYADGTFKPENAITRGEFVKLLVTYKGYPKTSGHGYKDVYGHWAEEYIATAAHKGWVTGYQDETFKPDAPITRAEAVTMINRAFERNPRQDGILYNQTQPFTDVNATHWAYVNIVEASNEHKFSKYPDGAEYWTSVTKKK